MPITIQDAVNHLYGVAVVQGKRQSPARLNVLARFCLEELQQRGLSGARVNQTLKGGGRPKEWDVTWDHDGKCRLAISLKSILKNLAGTVPNRIDDLMGEVANAQMHSPEIVIGYIMVLAIESDAYSPKHDSTWSDLLLSRLQALSHRRPPTWTFGTIEAFALVRVDFSQTGVFLSSFPDMGEFFDILTEQVQLRNPSLR